MTIPKITPYTGGVANPDGSQTQTEFTQNMFDQLSYEAELSTELNNTVDGINDTATQVDADATSAAQSASAAEAAVSGLNYQGLWPDSGGIAEKGDTYQTQASGVPTGQYFTALQNTTVDPVGDNVNWRSVVTSEQVSTGDSQVLGGKIWPLSSNSNAEVGDDITGFEFVRFDGRIYKVTPELSGQIVSIDYSEIETSGVGGDPSALIPVENVTTLNNQKLEGLKNVIASFAGDGFNFVTLGDSTEAGVGGTGSSYAQVTSDLRNGFTNRVGYSLVKSDPNFVGIDPQSKNYTAFPVSSTETAYECSSLVVSQNASYETIVYSQSRNSRSDLTVYYHQRTSDAAARGAVSVYSLTGSLITSELLDSYTPEITFGAAGSFPVAGRLQKITIPLSVSTRGVRVVVDSLDVIDRGQGVPADGTLFLYGFSLGKGIGVHNLSVSSSTLTEGSADNIMRGIDTSERVALAKSLDADVVYIGWGTNDSKSGVTTLEQFKDDYRTLIDDFRSWKSSVQLILGTDPKGLGAPYLDNTLYNNAVRDVAAEKDCVLFDVETIFDVSPSDFYSDFVHPSAKGYQALHYALCNFLGVDPFEISTTRYAQNRTVTRSATFAIPVTSDFSGSFIEVLNETLTVPNWARGFIILCDINISRSGSDIDSCSAELVVNGFSVDRKVVSSAQVNGVANTQISMNYNADPVLLPSDLQVQVNLRDYNIRATDSTSGVRVRFV